MENNEQNKTPLFKLKYLGYFNAGFDLERSDITYNDFVTIAKYHLSEKKGVLIKDPIWDSYTAEEILIEYYASVYKENEEARKSFETHLNATQDDDQWMEEQVKLNKKRREQEAQKAVKMEDEILFDPTTETLGNE